MPCPQTGQVGRPARGSSENDLKLLASTNASLVIDRQVSPGKDYCYRVSALNGRGEGNAIGTAYVRIQVSETSQSSQPMLYIASALTCVILLAAAAVLLVWRQKRGAPPSTGGG